MIERGGERKVEENCSLHHLKTANDQFEICGIVTILLVTAISVTSRPSLLPSRVPLTFPQLSVCLHPDLHENMLDAQTINEIITKKTDAATKTQAIELK